MIERYLPLIGMLLLAGIAMVWRPWLQYRRHGTWGIIVFRSSSRLQYIRDAAAVAAFAALIWQAAAAAIDPASIPLLLDRARGALGVLNIAGAILMIGGLVLLVVAQLDLGASWRIGIDEDARPGLVTGGLYRFSRNPIFAGLLMIIAGNALLLPTCLSILLFIGAYVGVRQQITAEEKYLARTYGEEYRDYARRVGRFLPGIGPSPPQ